MQDGKLPLHWAAEKQAGPLVVSALLLAYPDTASKPDGVHCGCDMGYCACSVSMCAACFVGQYGVHSYIQIYIYIYMCIYI